MAISKPTPKDIGTYESKLIGPFTQRQSVCIAAGLIPSFIIGSFLNGLGFDGYVIACSIIVIMIIPCFLAFGSVLCHGMKPEDFVLEYYYYHIKSKNVRLYETETLDDKIDIVRKKEQEEEAKKLGIEDESKKNGSKKSSKEKVTKTRFKDSRFTPYAHKESKEYRSIS